MRYLLDGKYVSREERDKHLEAVAKKRAEELEKKIKAETAGK